MTEGVGTEQRTQSLYLRLKKEFVSIYVQYRVLTETGKPGK